MKYCFLLLLITVFYIHLYSQTLSSGRRTDWTLAGLKDTSTAGFEFIDLQSRGIIGDNSTANDSVLAAVLASVSSPGAILNFPSGTFLFNKTIELSDNIVLRGKGVENTTLRMNLGGSSNAIEIKGSSLSSDTSSLVQQALKDSLFLNVSDPSLFAPGDWLQIIQTDSDLLTSNWAYNSVGQIVQIDSLSSNRLFLNSSLRMDISLSRSPFVKKINPIKNIGIECIKIERIDDTSPQQSSSVYFSYAVNCWVKGIESYKCTFSHIEANNSSNLYIGDSYFHHAFSYGEGGRAYGVLLQFATNESRVENNVFEHLRHSMILQAGANGNVFAYNYSFDPYWTNPPAPVNSAGDIVLHGNYVFFNLFEQNICQTIAVDNSHGANGPFNTFFRNRAESYGINSNASSPNQNFIGNEITNTASPYSYFNYSIQGTGHFIYGNNNKGTIHPPGTDSLPDSTYAYKQRPDFIPSAQWSKIGTPNAMGSAGIPALLRYNSGTIVENICAEEIIQQVEELNVESFTYSNPFNKVLTIESIQEIKSLSVIHSSGKLMHSGASGRNSYKIKTASWPQGIYFLLMRFSGGNTSIKKIVKV